MGVQTRIKSYLGPDKTKKCVATKKTNKKDKKGSKKTHQHKTNASSPKSCAAPPLDASLGHLDQSLSELLASQTPMPITTPESVDMQSIDDTSWADDSDAGGEIGAQTSADVPPPDSIPDDGSDLSRLHLHTQYLADANNRLQTQIELLESDIDNHLKLDSIQKTAIKKLTRENDNLRRELSKHKGMRKFTVADETIGKDTGKCSRCDNTTAATSDELELAQAKLNSLRDHIKCTANELLCAVSEGSKEDLHVDDGFQPCVARRRRRNRCTQTNGPTTTPNPAPPGPTNNQRVQHQGTDASSRHHNRPDHSFTYADALIRPRKAPNNPDTIVIGTSLVRGVGAHLKRRDIDNVCYTYPGADIPQIRSRICHVLPHKHSPKQIVLQVGGNDAEAHPAAPIVKQYDALISQIKARCPRSTIIVNRIPPRRFNNWTNKKIDMINTFLSNRSLKGDGVKFVDNCPSFPDHFKRDRVHFSRDGCQVYADKMACNLINFQLGTKKKRN